MTATTGKDFLPIADKKDRKHHYRDAAAMRDHSKINSRFSAKRPVGIISVKELLEHAQHMAEIRKHILEHYYDHPDVLRIIADHVKPRLK